MRRLWGLLLVASLVLASCASEPPPLGRTVSEGLGGSSAVGSGEVNEGDCVDLPDGTGPTSSFTPVACNEEHDGQIAAIFDLDLGEEWPGASEVLIGAETGCVARFEDFVGVSYEQSIFFLQSFTPTEDSWANFDDRSVLCVLIPADGEGPLVEDLQGIEK